MIVDLIGLPLDLGADRRGVDMGPTAIRIAGVKKNLERLGYQVHDKGNIDVEVPEILKIADPRLKYLAEIVKACTTLAQEVEASLESGSFPLVLGGDHSIAIGTVSGVASHFRKNDKTLGMIWVDAHGDMNTNETTPSGNIHGMPFAALLGRGAKELTSICGDFPKVEPNNCVLVGARDLDPKEQEIIKASGIAVYTMEEIDKRGLYAVMMDAIKIATANTDGLHVSFDMDALDPTVVPGVGTPVRGGFTYREAHAVMEAISRSYKLVSLEIVEVNPILDVRNSTAQIAAELVQSALGKRIL